MVKENRLGHPRTPFVVPCTPRSKPQSPILERRTYGELFPRNQDTSSLAFRYHPAFHQGGACCVARYELEHGLSAGFDQHQDALSRRLPPTLNRKSSHALVIPDSYPEVALEALPESLLVHASLPAVTDPVIPDKGRCLPLCLVSRIVPRAPLSSNPAAPLAFTRESC